MTLLIAMVNVSASAKIPTTPQVLRLTKQWVRTLPPQRVIYRAVATVNNTTQTERLEFNAARMLRTDLNALKKSVIFKLLGSLLRGEGEKQLRQFGINTNVTNLYHLHRRVVVIVGAGPRHPNRPQVWFDQKTGVPVLLRILREKGTQEELQLGDFNAPGTGGKFPGSFVWRGPNDVVVNATLRVVR